MNTSPSTSNCANCCAQLHGKFCHQCGQKQMTERFSVKLLLNAFLKKIFDVETGLWFTTKELMVRPGKVVRDYLHGAQINYTKPVQFFFLTTALVFIALGFSDLYQQNVTSFEQGFNYGYGDGKEIPSHVKHYIAQISFWIKDIRIFIISSIPIYALLFQWMFRRAKLNYAEHVIFLLYATAQSNLIALPFFVLGAYVEPMIIQVGALFSVIYIVWATQQFYQRPWLRGLAAYLLATVLYLIIVLVIFMLSAYILLSIYK
ncbi:MAG: DUF3667 domain-containing protein [Flammeovirgaceae bacterium]